MIAVINLNKDYSEITLEDVSEIEEFVFDYLQWAGAHMSKAYNDTWCTDALIEMEWNVFTTAVHTLCTNAVMHKDEFIRMSF